MSAADLLAGPAAGIAAAMRERRVRAADMVEASVARIERTDGTVNAFTDRTFERARRRAAELDALLASPGPDAAVAALPLLGVPFAVKNLFDVAGLTTRAGSKIERDRPPAHRDGVLVERLEAAGAVLVGALNMDEYAYGFTTENSHDGPTRNPHDLARVAGGSSGGSAAAVAAGQVPVSLGSDTNGSIRVPASLCGVFGLKPTYGRLPRTGTYPFVASLDHLGPFARSAHDLALVYDALQGIDRADPACADRGGRAARRAARHAGEVVRVARRTVVRVLGREAIGVLVHVERADEHRSGLLEARDQRAVRVGGRTLALDLRAGARRQAGDVEEVLDSERHAGERQRAARAIAAGQSSVERRGAPAGALGDDVGEGVDRRIDSGDARQARLDHRRRADGARSHRLGDRGGGAGEELAGSHRGDSPSAPAARSSGPIGVNAGAGSSPAPSGTAITASASPAASAK